MSDNNEDEKQVDPYEAPFFYTSKASRSERDLGCEHLYWKYDHKRNPIRISEEEYEELQDDDDVRVTSGSIHPTTKPIDVMEWLINRISEPGDTVLDPFAGSGTTGIAAMKTGRSCKMVELDDEGVYQDIIEGRLHGQKKAYLEELPASERPDIEFLGEISKEDPRINHEDTILGVFIGDEEE